MAEKVVKNRTESLELNYEEFKQILLCPVCQEIALSPIYQCENGHLICSECIDEIPDAKCPCCRVPLPGNNIRALAVEQLTQNVKVDCKHRAKGCSTAIRMVDYPEHLAECNYQALQYCRLLQANCDEMVTASEFRDHVEAKHGHTTFHIEGTRGLIFQEVNKADLNDLEVSWEPIFMLEKEKVFIILSKYDINDHTFSWRCVAGPAVDCVVELDGVKDDGAYQVHMVIEKESSVSAPIKLQWSGPVIPFLGLKQGAAHKDPTIHSFYVPAKVLHSFNTAEDPDMLKWMIKVVVSEVHCTLIDPFTLFQNDIANGCEIPSVPSIYYHTNEDGAKASFHKVQCDSCDSLHIKGVRYKCAECPNYDLCTSCKRLGTHNHHVFLSISSVKMTEKLMEFSRKLR